MCISSAHSTVCARVRVFCVWGGGRVPACVGGRCMADDAGALGMCSCASVVRASAIAYMRLPC